MVVGADAVDLDKILPEQKKVVEADPGEDVVAAEETFMTEENVVVVHFN